MKQRKYFFPEKAKVGLISLASTDLNPYAIYSKQFLTDKSIK